MSIVLDVKGRTFNSLVNYYNKEKNLKKFIAVCQSMVKSKDSTPEMRGEICESVLYVMLTDFIVKHNLKDWRISKGLILKNVSDGSNPNYLTELDLTLFTPKCVFSFECKSYKGEKFLCDKGTLYLKNGVGRKKRMDIFAQHIKHFYVLEDNIRIALKEVLPSKYKSYRLLCFEFSDTPLIDERDDKYKGLFPVCTVNNLYNIFKSYNERPDYWDMERINKVVDIIEKAGKKNKKSHLDYVTSINRNRS